MRFSKLGNTDIEVSRICLGTMTWGTQNNQQDANAQIEYALSKGINFIDTAELYSIPPCAESYGKTETHIGNWIANNRNQREKFVLASKICGAGVPHIREGSPITSDAIKAAVDDSLRRLQTDYIDLYQLHWPNRPTAHMGNHWPNQLNYEQRFAKRQIDGMHDMLRGLADCVAAGKIRYCGLSNDAPWGISQFLKLSEEHNLPRVISIQNEFNLLSSKDWPYLIEQCVMEDIAYLPWSPLAGGVLSGKYIGGARPAGSRWTHQQRNGLFRDTETVDDAVTAYQAIAEKHGITTAQLALKWIDQISGVSSTIIGATSLQQLEENIQAFDIDFTDELAGEVNAILKKHLSPF